MSKGNSHFHLHCSWRFFEMGTIRCFSHHYPLHIWSQCTTNASTRLHCDTDCIQRHYINIYSVKNSASREWDHCVLCGPTAYSNNNRIFNDPIGWWVAVSVSSIVCTYALDPPGPLSTIRHSILSNSANEVSVSVQWEPPTETGGRDALTYTVTISPPAQLSATLLTSTSVAVTVRYNVDYTVSVVATNCAGNSATAEYNFSTGELTASLNQQAILIFL